MKVVQHIMTEPYRSLNSFLEGRRGLFEDGNSMFANQIFDLVDTGRLTKLQALILLDTHKLLPVSGYIIDNPAILEAIYDKGFFDRHETIRFGSLVNDYAFMFADEDGECSEETKFPNITISNAVDELYRIAKEHRVIGCIYDW